MGTFAGWIPGWAMDDFSVHYITFLHCVPAIHFALVGGLGGSGSVWFGLACFCFCFAAFTCAGFGGVCFFLPVCFSSSFYVFFPNLCFMFYFNHPVLFLADIRVGD
ncbi:hypothetical protein B0T19DRAFT_408402 [Cercophora scortea]|uniref:Uncharacterized protein n=1 Tax=Cercophora scortea TaxID=314031 RepID=A0AAE0MKL4_9PEZI|nr:hypothetical protein B0T19DRAFT_408402 [Cercophora scortea]